MSERAREAAHAIWRAALAAGDVTPLISRAVRRQGSRALIGDRPCPSRVLVFGCGKASGAMARAVEDVLGARIAYGLVVVKDGYTVPTRRVRLVEAGHPVPDARGEAAALEIVHRVRGAGADDLVLFLVSGGGSALTPAPAPPVTLAEKQETTRLLLAAGTRASTPLRCSTASASAKVLRSGAVGPDAMTSSGSPTTSDRMSETTAAGAAARAS